MKQIVLLLAAASLLSACASTPENASALAESPAPQVSDEVAAAQVDQKVADKDRIICRRETELGTRFPKTVCLTEEQRHDLAEQNQRELMKARRYPLPGQGGG